MGLADELRADEVGATRCQMCKWLEEQDEETQKEWDEVLVDRSFPHTRIARALARRHIPISHGAVGSHRRARHREL